MDDVKKLNISSTRKLSNGQKMPRLGLGVSKANDNEATNSVKWAIEAGYKLIDTASFYGNEVGVGRGIKESNVKREDVFITTKVWNDDQGYEKTLAAFDKSLKKLQLDYVDLYLIHWPISDLYKGTWRALEKLYKEGLAVGIGVCNFYEHHLYDLLNEAEVKPVIDQVELHPLLNQLPLRVYCRDNDIAVEAWSPLAQGNLLNDQRLIEMGKKYNKTPAQLILRWDLENNVIIIPKSVKRERIHENADIFDFELMPDDIQTINEFNTGQRFGNYPAEFTENSFGPQ